MKSKEYSKLAKLFAKKFPVVNEAESLDEVSKKDQACIRCYNFLQTMAAVKIQKKLIKKLIKEYPDIRIAMGRLPLIQEDHDNIKQTD